MRSDTHDMVRQTPALVNAQRRTHRPSPRTPVHRTLRPASSAPCPVLSAVGYCQQSANIRTVSWAALLQNTTAIVVETSKAHQIAVSKSGRTQSMPLKVWIWETVRDGSPIQVNQRLTTHGADFGNETTWETVRDGSPIQVNQRLTTHGADFGNETT